MRGCPGMPASGGFRLEWTLSKNQQPRVSHGRGFPQPTSLAMRHTIFGRSPVVLLFALYFVCPSVSVLLLQAQTAPRGRRVLVSRADIESLVVRESSVHVERLGGESEFYWRVATRRGSAYPGLFVAKKRGSWSLKSGDRLSAEVRNLEGKPLKVVLVANNAESNGRDRCSAASAVIPAHATGTISLLLGQWHGQQARRFDPSRVATIGVMLERPKGSLRIEVGEIAVTAVDRRGLAELAKTAAFGRLARPLGRGINLGNALDAPKEGAWGYRLEEAHFAAIGEAGFNFVRIPIRWSAHMRTSPPYTIDESFAERVDWALEQARRNGLGAIVNVHHFDEIMQQPQQQRARFLAIWKQLAQRYREAPATVSFELLNEPHSRLGANDWNKLLAEAIGIIRRTNPRRTIIVGPVRYNNIAALESLTVPKDEHLVATIHYYSPFEFTHQGASWVGADASRWLGTKWRGTAGEKAAVRRDFDLALRWSVEHECPLLLGEFGAIAKADIESRAKWTRFVAEEAWKRKMGYAYWGFDAGFDAYDVKAGRWHRPILEALIRQ